MRNPDVIHSGTNIYRLNDRYPLAGVAQGATLFPAAFQGFRQQGVDLADNILGLFILKNWVLGAALHRRARYLLAAPCLAPPSAVALGEKITWPGV